MLIRSQDKLSLIPIELDGITTEKYAKKDGEYHVSNKYNTEYEKVFVIRANQILGEYSSDEKAIKVLDKICEQYGRYTCRYGGDHSVDAVYQMPQDSEVE